RGDAKTAPPTRSGACDGRDRERSRTVYRANDTRAYEGKLRTLKRPGDLADLDAGTKPCGSLVAVHGRGSARNRSPSVPVDTPPPASIRRYARARSTARSTRASGTGGMGCAASDAPTRARLITVVSTTL